VPPKKSNPAQKAPAKSRADAAKVKAAPAAPAVPDLRPAPAPVFGNIPWGYGDNRMTAMARDPRNLFAYWEVTDEGFEGARKKIGDPNAGLAIRVYETTGRIFDGLNPNHFWDIGVDRGTNCYYLHVGRPGAVFHLDIGAKSGSGAYAPIARSGAVEMPREWVSGDGRVEWSSMMRSGAAASYHHRFVPRPGGPPPPQSSFDTGAGREPDQIFQSLAGEGWKRSEWVESLMDGRVVRWIRWSGPFIAERLPVALTGTWHRIEVLFEGERRTVKFEGREQHFFGPWKIVMEAVGPRGERRFVQQWMMRKSWTTEEGRVVVETPAILRSILGGQRVVWEQSGSEARMLKETWGSEMLQRGASEWAWRGASETLMAGASETEFVGGTETLYLGGTESQFRGASEQWWFGASETLGGGASEQSHLGGSERLGGGSEEGRP
jgi:hypothetical protein